MHAKKEKERKRVIRFNNATLRPALPRLRNKNENGNDRGKDRVGLGKIYGKGTD